MRRWLVFSFLAALVAAERFVHAHHPFWWQALPAFALVYGLAGSVVLIYTAAGLGHGWLQRREDYYGDDAS
ncbi:MAG: hypothetical protein KatS3mg131_0986 [Candidatus Tectimicrobiota bacterium]|nr:MAG: hypothetical protein KatS3mg131_0986 [Candidatus Tectomicrobia bacterium]